MATFGSFSEETIIGFNSVHKEPSANVERLGSEIRTFSPRVDDSRGGHLVARSNTGRAVPNDELADQFLVFQWNSDATGPRILPCNQVTPSLKGEKPDVLAKIELLSFHVSQRQKTDATAKAIMRVDFGQDEDSNSQLDRVTYSIMAGLDLYNQTQGKPSQPKELKADFSEAFAKRPIEIAGGLSKLRFEVCTLREPTWWQRVFKWLQSDAAKALTAAVGFPALTTQAVGIVDEFINGLLGTDKPEVLMKSRPMTLALTSAAKEDFTQGLPGIQVGSLKPGICLFARGADFPTIVAANPVYRGEFGLLVPGDVTEDQLHTSNYKDPFADMTYGVFKLRLAETSVSPF